jgi:hypothetical protein
MACVVVSDRQSLMDIATRELGGLDNLFEFALINDVSLTDDPTPGQTISLIDITNSDVVSYYKNKNINPATAITTLTEEQARIYSEEYSDEFE